VMLNFAEVAPAATVTVAGTLADASELLSVTTAPVAGAGPLRETELAEEDMPPAIAVGDRLTAEIVIGLTVRVAGFVIPP